MKAIRYIYVVVMDAFYTFLADDGWAIASHIALSTLMALFPFLIVLTSLAGVFGSKELADQAASLMLQVWPKQVADLISGEVHDVLTTTRTGILTIGAALSVYFASNGVEALRVALNRAYAVVEMRRWYWLRLESIAYTLIAAFTALAMAFLIVLGPLIIEAAQLAFPCSSDRTKAFSPGCATASPSARSWLRCSSCTPGCRRDGAASSRSCRASSSRWWRPWSPASSSDSIWRASPTTT